MAVSGKTAAPHEIPFYLGTDKPPDMAEVTKAIAERTAGQLDAIAPKQIVGPTKKQLLIANASGVVTAVTASGDVTNDESGVFTIGAEKVTAGKLAPSAAEEAKIKDGAVTSRKAKLTAGVVTATENLMLTGAYQNMPGTELKITPAVASILKITAFFDFELGASVLTKMLGTIKVDTEAEDTHVAFMAASTNGARDTAGQVYAVPLTTATHTINLRAKQIEGEKGQAIFGNTRFLYELIAS